MRGDGGNHDGGIEPATLTRHIDGGRRDIRGEGRIERKESKGKE